MKKVLFIFGLLYFGQLNAQVTKYAHVILGSEYGAYFSIPTKYGRSVGFPDIRVNRFVPHLDVRVYKSLYLGASYEYSFGHVNGEKLDNEKAYGFQLKYFINPFKNKTAAHRFLLNGDLTYLWANYFLDGNEKYGIGFLNGYDSRLVDVGVTASFNVVSKLYFYFGYRYIYYFYNNKSIKFANKLGLQYHFGEQRAKKLNNNLRELVRREFAPFRNKEQKSIGNKDAYLRFADRAEYSTSFVYVPHYERDVNDEKFWYHEFTWYNGFSVNINKSIYFGFQYLYIFTRGSTTIPNNPNNPKNNYHIFGVNLLYDVYPVYSDKLFIMASYSLGNYCTCGNFDPYKKEGLNYFGLGIGYDYPILKRLSFRAGFTNYLILNKIEGKYSYTQYTLGLNLNLGKPYNRSKTKFRELFFDD